MEERQREPCPDRILDDLGGAFGMGAVGGGAFHFLKGIYNSPAGARFLGGTQAVRMNAPRVGGSFAVWGGLFSAFDCATAYVRQKEDPWNSVISGAATGGLLAMRQGFNATGKAALVGGAFLALIEGVSLMVNKHMSALQNEAQFNMEGPGSVQAGVPMGLPSHMFGQSVPESSAAASEEGTGSWFGGLFGNGKKKEAEDKSGSKTQILESFDAPPVPTYEFK